MIRRRILRVAYLLLALPLLAIISFSEQLPVKKYTASDGLPRDAVTLVRQDSRGFIWLAAGDGLSRFDGYKFTNYTTDDGLADRRVNDLLETRSGIYWIATDAGLCRFNPTGSSKRGRKSVSVADIDERGSTIEPMFVAYNPTEKPIAFNALLEDETGAIWCATSEGLYRLEVSADGGVLFHLIELGSQPGKVVNRNVTALLKDRHGVLWCSVGATLNRLLPDGRVEQYSRKQGLTAGLITSLIEDHEGSIWAGTRIGLEGKLLKLVPAPDPSHSVVARVYGPKDGLAAGWINKLTQTRDGKLWASTLSGLCLISFSEAGTLQFQLYNASNGLCVSTTDVTDDRAGNLWVASACGALKVSRHGFTGYGPSDGLGPTQINSIFENRDGALFVISKFGDRSSSARFISRFDGASFTTTFPKLPSSTRYQGWGWGQTIFQDHTGDWWIPSFGLFRFPKVDRIEDLAQAHPQVIKTLSGDYDHTEIFRLYEDSRGDVWIAMTGLHRSLLRWERTTGVVHDHTAEASVPATTEYTAFAEDHAGNLWIGTSEGGGLLRYRDGKFKRFTTVDGTPPGWMIWLYVDHAGRLWIASQLGGLNCIADTSANSLHLMKYSTAEGLSSNNIRTITEDEWGRIYVGTGHGVDRLDLETGAIKHFTAADGLPRGIIEVAYRDRQGALWFGSQFGLSRFIPDEQEPHILPSVFITGLRIEGVAHRVSEIGAADLPTLDLSSNQRQVSVEFVGLGASLGEELRYQYRLEGSHDAWSTPTSERTITFANLAPGAYRFRVQALDADGRASLSPATFGFNIAAPIWQRSWFLTLSAIAAGLTIYLVYRYRLGRQLELERIRTRIATDLHDDVGSGLSQVAILSEVIGRRVGHDEGVAEQLSTIGSLSRDLVDSMSDIVWAINPVRDRLSDLSYRMRRFTSDVFSSHGVEFVFNVTNPSRDIRLDPELRREFYLIFKEAVNNVVRHSSCTEVQISFLISDRDLELLVHDNGEGFEPECDSEGNGLPNMRQRAKKLKGDLLINSNGEGTTVHLIVPVKRRRWFELGLTRNRN